MKWGQLLFGIFIGGLLGFGWAKYFHQIKDKDQNPAVATNESKIPAVKWQWPDSLDATKAAPENHKIVFEDSSVRVLQVILDGHKAEPIHTHKWRSIMWITKPALPCRIYQYKEVGKGKFVVADSVSISHMDINIGYFNEAENPTAIRNLSNQNGIAYRVEFKKEFK